MSAIKEKLSLAEVTPDREIVITRVFDAPREMFWMPTRVAKLELRPGGTFLYSLMRERNKKPAGSPTGLLKMQRRAAQPEALSRFARVGGMEVDNLAPQFFRRPLLLRRLEICRNVEFNQFRHNVLLAGNPQLSGVLRSHRKPESLQAHVSLFPHYFSCSGKLRATSRNTVVKLELFPRTREKAQVWLRNVCSEAKRKAQLFTGNK
jgi:hypothetical protein